MAPPTQWLTVAHSGHGSQRTDSAAQLSQTRLKTSRIRFGFDLVRLGSVRFGLIFKYASYSYSCPEESDKLSQSVRQSVSLSVCRAAKRVGLRRRPSPWARIKCAQDFEFFLFGFRFWVYFLVFGSYLGNVGGAEALRRFSSATFHLLLGRHFGISFSGRMPLI